MLITFPWLLVPFGLYNAIAFLFTKGAPQEAFSKTVASFRLASGTVWQLTAGDALVALGLLLLFAEFLKATRFVSLTLIDRTLSAVLFLACAVEFAVRKEAATTAFFLITLMSLIEFIGGITLTIKASLRAAQP